MRISISQWTYLFVQILSITAIVRPGYSQNTFELVQDGMHNSVKPPASIGPTSLPQTLVFFLNKNGNIDLGIDFEQPTKTLSMTVAFEDQAYVNVPEHLTGMSFGAVSGASTRHVKPVPVVNTDYNYKEYTRTIFTSNPQGPSGNGIDLSTNAGLQVFLSAKPLRVSNAPRLDSCRYYYGRIRVTFSRPVSNPVLSFVGLGASTNFWNKKLGFATELELQTPSLILTKLSGTDQLLIDESGTKILHSRTPITGHCDTGAACGSVLVKGMEISTLVFNVFLRPDGRAGVWGTEKVTNSGDAWHMTVSLPEQ